MKMMLLETLVVMSYIAVGVLSFWAGKCLEEDKNKKKLSARVIRPVNIKVDRHYHVTEYVIKKGEQLDIDFPPVEKVR